MRGREMDKSPNGSDSAAPSLSPPRRIAVNLSSMVVKPSASSGGGSDIENGYAADARLRDSPLPLLRHGSPHDLHRRVSPSYDRRRIGSSPMHRRDSPDAFRRRVPQPGIRRRGSPIGFYCRGPSPVFHPRSQRFHDNPGYMQRAGSISPPRRPRMDDGYYESYRSHPSGPRSGRGMRGRGNRFHHVSPTRLGRSGRPHERGFNPLVQSIDPSEREFVHRNDPNLSPREGDWICQNPNCGNLNFARRTYCNNCNKYRYDEFYVPEQSPPRRGYVSPPHRGFLPRVQAPSGDRLPRRDFSRYRSPWNTDDPRDLGTSLPHPRRGGKLVDTIRRGRVDFRETTTTFRERGRSDWLGNNEPEPRGRRDAFAMARRSLDRQSLSPRYGWIHGGRDRSRSPMDDRLHGDSFMERDDRHYGGSYMSSPRADGCRTWERL
ncbi:hypothetical protein HPP92_000487 [Vanilla planifolia]|uniref:RanBP2-type domain-containing protein n=1 Tax=Vanilla planifolia TaxID=51239 RepID=A0A835S4X6_VANPL|nr:hypothetical protein HPP92_000487 [Vanilla planifolia]